MTLRWALLGVAVGASAVAIAVEGCDPGTATTSVFVLSGPAECTGGSSAAAALVSALGTLKGRNARTRHNQGAAFRRRHTARTLILAPLSGAVGTF